MQCFSQQLQTQLSQKRKAFSGFFIALLKCTSSLENFKKKDGPSSFSYAEIMVPKEVDTRKCLKGVTSEHVSVNNVLANSKHCSNQHGTTITEYFHESGIN